MPSIEERFWSKVSKTPDCWEWTAYRSQGGYGTFQYAHRVKRRAHRVSWELSNGPVPDGLHVLHRCDNRACVRPDHLFLGTHRDNMRDMAAKGRAALSLIKGEDHYAAKLQEADVRFIRSSDAPASQLAARFNIHRNHIYLIRKRRVWAHI